MQFSDIQEARDFLAQHPDVHLIELFLIAANGVPRGKARSGRLETASRRRSIFLSTPSERV